jgi:hypothetical protein
MCNPIPKRRAMKKNWSSGPRPVSHEEHKKYQAPDAIERELLVVVSGHCPQCTEAIEMAHRVALEFPALAVQIIYLDRPGAVKPEAVFAVPTYLLDRRIISLGNPSMDEIRCRISSVLPSSSVTSLQRTPHGQRG